MNEKLINEVQAQEVVEFTSEKKRAYSTPELIEETVFERAVLAACKQFGLDPGCEGFPS